MSHAFITIVLSTAKWLLDLRRQQLNLPLQKQDKKDGENDFRERLISTISEKGTLGTLAICVSLTTKFRKRKVWQVWKGW